MFYQLDDYFTNKGYELLHTAGFLTIAGEPDWFEDEDDDEDEDGDSDDEYDSEEEDEETYDVVSTLCVFGRWVCFVGVLRERGSDIPCSSVRRMGG